MRSSGLLVFLSLTLVPSISVSSQSRFLPSRSKASVSDTPGADGLQQCLSRMTSVAKSADKKELAKPIKRMEMPFPNQWSTPPDFDQEKPGSMAWYRGNYKQDEKAFAYLLKQFSTREGKFLVRNVNEYLSP